MNVDFDSDPDSDLDNPGTGFLLPPRWGKVGKGVVRWSGRAFSPPPPCPSPVKVEGTP